MEEGITLTTQEVRELIWLLAEASERLKRTDQDSNVLLASVIDDTAFNVADRLQQEGGSP